MSKSIEHSPKFHMIRRIAKVIAPDFRILARSDFERQESCLDLKEKTIEVSEKATPFEAVGIALFHLGHLRLKSQKRFSDHFGDFKSDNAEEIVKRLSRQGAMADRYAAEWALSVFVGNFNVDQARAESIISAQIWSEEDYEDYFASQTK